MPTNDKGRQYSAHESAGRFDVTHHLETVDNAGSDIAVHDAFVLFATLGVHEYYETSLGGSHNDITWIARAPGVSPLTVRYLDPSGNDKKLSVVYTTNLITVNLATGPAGAITSTASQILAAANAASAVTKRVVPVLAAGNNGSGIVTAKSVENFVGVGGGSPKMDVSLQTSFDGSNWYVVKAYAQKSAVGFERLAFGPLGTYCRWDYNLDGTYPIFPTSISDCKVRWARS